MATSGSLSTSSYNIDGNSDHQRYLTLSWSRTSYSVENNTSTLSWTLKGAGGSTNYYYCAGNFNAVINGITVYSSAARIELYNGTTVASGTITIEHNGDGTKSFTASAQAGIYYTAVNCSGSGSFTLDTIPRASSLIASNGTLGTAQTLTISRASSSFTHKITYACGSLSGQTAGLSASSGIATSCTFTPPLSLASQNTAGSAVTVTFTLSTYNGSTLIGSKATVISCAIPASVKPTCSYTLSDPSGKLATYGAYVQGYSQVKATITASGSYGSTITSYTTVVAATGGTYAGNPATSAAVTKTGTQNVTVTVTDSRGRPSTQVIKQITVLEYAAPVVALSAYRCTSTGTADQEGAYMKLSISSTISSLNNQNSATYTIKYKKSTDSSWTTLTGGGTNYTSSVIACDVASIWNVEGTITDEITTTTKAVTIPIAFVLMDYYNTGKGLAFGKVATGDGFECAMDAHFTGGFQVTGFVDKIYPVGSIYMSISSTSPASIFGGSWTQIKGRFLLGVGIPDNNNASAFGSNLTYNGSNKYNEAAGNMGGESLHTLIRGELPNETLKVIDGSYGSSNIGTAGYGTPVGSDYPAITTTRATPSESQKLRTDALGSGWAHSNMPPYYAVYMWKRTA